MKHRIAFVIHSLKIGGSEKFFVELVNGCYRAGLDPLVILLERENPMLPQLDPGLSLHIIPRRFKYDLTVSFRIRKLLTDQQVGKLFCVEPYSFFLARLANYFSQDVRYFLSLHNSIPIGRKKYLLEMAYLRLFRTTDTAIFICHYQREYFLKKYLFSPWYSHVIYNGIDTEKYSPLAAEAELKAAQQDWRMRLGIGPNEPVVLMVGRLSPEKGHAYALRALKQLQTGHGLRAHLVIVGDGPESASLKSLAAASGIERYVHFEGSQQEVRQYHLYADLFALTSVSETFSLAALEALSMGLPCSLTRVGGAEEMITAATGDLCSPRDITSIAQSWCRLLKAGLNRNQIRMEAAARFSRSVMLRRYIDALDENMVGHEKEL